MCCYFHRFQPLSDAFVAMPGLPIATRKLACVFVQGIRKIATFDSNARISAAGLADLEGPSALAVG